MKILFYNLLIFFLKITDRACNPGLLGIVTHAGISNATTPAPGPAQAHSGLDASSIVSLILWFLVILYSSFTSASKGGILLGNNKESTSLTDAERMKAVNFFC
jgi:hypothetical protein